MHALGTNAEKLCFTVQVFCMVIFQTKFSIMNSCSDFFGGKIKSSFVSVLHTSLDISVLCQSIYL